MAILTQRHDDLAETRARLEAAANESALSSKFNQVFLQDSRDGGTHKQVLLVRGARQVALVY